MSFELELSIPPHFFDSTRKKNNSESVSERIAKLFLTEICKVQNLRRGDANVFEPDYVSGKNGYEVTFAIKDSIIQQFKGIRPLDKSFRNSESEVIADIKESLENKKDKTYSVPTSLVIITVDTIIPWYAPFYMDLSDRFMQSYWKQRNQRRNAFFNSIYKEYILSKKMENIFIINPTIKQEFALFDISAFYNGEKEAIIQVATDNPIAFPSYKITNVIKDDNPLFSKTTIINNSIK